MTHPGGTLPDELYAEGLQQADEAMIRQIYSEFRQPVIRAAVLLGASPTDAARLFQAAVVEVARRVQAGAFPGDLPFFELLEQLVTAQLDHKNDEENAAIQEVALPLSGVIALIESWKHARPHADETIPSGYAVWQITNDIERRLTPDKPVNSPEPAANKVWRLVLLALAILTLLYAGYTWFNRPKGTSDVFESNFMPPESFVADRRLRYSAEEDSSGAMAPGNDCDRLLQQSDQLYQNREFESAQEPLLLLVLDSMGACQSDAWYFLSILRMELGDPVTAIECLTKIEDLDHYGDDIQWYMAVALLQMSDSEPSVREKAVRALERVIDSTNSEDRKARAAKMLEQLK